ncbi:MAG: Flp pilus assembly complex ATPase component TadA, partial [Planctomycetes bacterium]|nr:Flp pilus assembly complex ATPase component TadA [Planctomycetota bacterium]
FLRQDPDVILVGEIRDRETAEISIEAALTGHLLFSTLHTNDAPSTVTRMIDMDIEPFLVSSALLCVCAQRLMRKLCSCKETYRPTAKELEGLDMDWPPDVSLQRPKGCPACSSTGYKGRIGIHELLVPGDEIRRLTNERVSSDILRKAAIEAGMIPLYRDALGKVKDGVTSLHEALMTVRKD